MLLSFSFCAEGEQEFSYSQVEGREQVASCFLLSTVVLAIGGL